MEKLANHIALQSIAEGGMEKRALNVGQLLRMGRNFALRGKLDRFKALVDRRSNAAYASSLDRHNAWRKAVDEHRQLKDHLLPWDVNPADRKLSTTMDRTPLNPVWITSDPKQTREVVDAGVRNNLADLLGRPDYVRHAVLSSPPEYDYNQLMTFSRALKQLDPELHQKVLTTGSF